MSSSSSNPEIPGPARSIGNNIIEYDKISFKDTGCYKLGKFYKENLTNSVLGTFSGTVLLTTIGLNVHIANISDTKWEWLLACYASYIGLKILEVGILYGMINGYYKKFRENQWGKGALMYTLFKLFSIVWAIENIALTALFYTRRDQLKDTNNTLGWMIVPIACFGFTSIWLVLLGGLLRLLLCNGGYNCYTYCLVAPFYACKNKYSKKEDV